MHLKQISLDPKLNEKTVKAMKKITPMMEQYLEVKSRHKEYLLFYRMGDFYELFFDDAIIASKELSITLTKRGKYMDQDIPMCGVPYHAVDTYLSRLIKADFKIAIAEQLEDENLNKTEKSYKKIFPRDVVRIITPGTIIEEQLLESSNNNYLLAICSRKGSFSISWVDVTTGEFRVRKLDTNKIIEDIKESFFKIDPKEIILTQESRDNLIISSEISKWSSRLTIVPDPFFDERNNVEKIKNIFNTNNIKSLGEFSPIEIKSLGALVEYVKLTQKEFTSKLANLKIENDSDTMLIDKTSTQSLEIFCRLNGEKEGSLHSILDNTVSPGGARLFRSHLKQPVTDLEKINKRLDYLQAFLSKDNLVNRIREYLKGAPDIERSLTRISSKFNNPRDTLSIKVFIEKSLLVINAIQKTGNQILMALIPKQNVISEVKNISSRIAQTLIDNPPTNISSGGYIKNNFSKKLDDLRNTKDSYTKKNLTLQRDYVELTGINTLKIKYNNFHGFFIEVTNKNTDKILNSERFMLIQTTKNFSRFQTEDLKKNSQEIINADFLLLDLEKFFFKELNTFILESYDSIHNFYQSINYIDVMTNNAFFASNNNLTRPTLLKSPQILIYGGRHPVVEASLKKQGESFVENDCILNNNVNTWLMTGPNMAGKSTFLRQNAIIVIMAQIGCFVPAKKAEIGIIDKVFTRIGASDDLSSGQSTFMTEMVETARIINGATKRSLVILDEVGRGTSTEDGFAIASAILDYLVREINCSTLFATHYHDLVDYTNHLEKISCRTLKTKNCDGEIVFLYKVIQGMSQSSFGLHVAKIAGIKPSILELALKYKKLKNSHKTANENLDMYEGQVFNESSENLGYIKKLLKKLDIDNITPKQAIEVLYNLKKKLP